MKRRPDVVVLSDLHLGTYGCHARELLNYLKDIQPQTLILNGDIIDFWAFKKNYFPKEHLEVIRRILKLSANGTKTYYLPGNHDDTLRKFGEISLGGIQLRNKLVFQINNKTHWAFHGDVFDMSIQRARWLAKLGSKGYDFLIKLNRSLNVIRGWLGMAPVSFSARIKKKVKGAVRYVSDFEETAIELAADNGYDYVICGHIHVPQIREVETKEGKKVIYLNSGDWIEHLTALEYENGDWRLYRYDESEYHTPNPRLQVEHSGADLRAHLQAATIPQPVSAATFDAV